MAESVAVVRAKRAAEAATSHGEAEPQFPRSISLLEEKFDAYEQANLMIFRSKSDCAPSSSTRDSGLLDTPDGSIVPANAAELVTRGARTSLRLPDSASSTGGEDPADDDAEGGGTWGGGAGGGDGGGGGASRREGSGNERAGASSSGRSVEDEGLGAVSRTYPLKSMRGSCLRPWREEQQCGEVELTGGMGKGSSRETQHSGEGDSCENGHAEGGGDALADVLPGAGGRSVGRGGAEDGVGAPLMRSLTEDFGRNGAAARPHMESGVLHDAEMDEMDGEVLQAYLSCFSSHLHFPSPLLSPSLPFSSSLLPSPYSLPFSPPLLPSPLLAPLLPRLPPSVCAFEAPHTAHHSLQPCDKRFSTCRRCSSECCTTATWGPLCGSCPCDSLLILPPSPLCVPEAFTRVLALQKRVLHYRDLGGFVLLMALFITILYMQADSSRSYDITAAHSVLYPPVRLLPACPPLPRSPTPPLPPSPTPPLSPSPLPLTHYPPPPYSTVPLPLTPLSSSPFTHSSSPPSQHHPLPPPLPHSPPAPLPHSPLPLYLTLPSTPFSPFPYPILSVPRLPSSPTPVNT
ncbi:unnamed protein product [Closterium sp. Naga37s-1]|nr:unnamed protein product [Closterium sp. Naga37s-1]